MYPPARFGMMDMVDGSRDPLVEAVLFRALFAIAPVLRILAPDWTLDVRP